MVDNGGEVRAGRGAYPGRVITGLGSPQGTQLEVVFTRTLKVLLRPGPNRYQGRSVCVPYGCCAGQETRGSEPGPGPEAPKPTGTGLLISVFFEVPSLSLLSGSRYTVSLSTCSLRLCLAVRVVTLAAVVLPAGIHMNSRLQVRYTPICFASMSCVCLVEHLALETWASRAAALTITTSLHNHLLLAVLVHLRYKVSEVGVCGQLGPIGQNSLALSALRTTAYS